jgi:eukaryotic-like serine/threonine-protein kinase
VVSVNSTLALQRAGEEGNALVQVSPEEWPSLSRLLDEALEMTPDARELWLKSLPPTDLRHEATLRFLLNHARGPETRQFLDVFPKVPAGAVPDVRRLAPGDIVGAYVIEEEIGRGGMGAVWRARRRDGVIKRPVALKLPHAGTHARRLIERFMSERDILAPLAHPNIARLYDTGFSDSGQPFIALEYVPGLHLTEYCDRHHLDVTRRLRLFQQVLRAVQYAHSHLVIHGDIKPSNVIVGTDGRAMLLDFGVATVVAARAEAEPEVEQSPQDDVALTPYYASPEQIARGPVTTASDVYSLGVMLRELLTGERYQTAASRTINACLNAIILKALSAEPAERYVTVDAFWQDIEHWLRKEPVIARAGSRWYRTNRFVARHRASVGVGGVAAVAVLSIAAIASLEAHTAAVERDRALAISARSESIAEFLNMLITEAGAAEKPVTVREMLERSEALANSQYRDNPEQRAAVLDTLAVYYQNTDQQTDRSRRMLDEALAALRNSRDADLRRKVACDHAESIDSRDRVAEAKRELNAVIDDPRVSPEQAARCLQFLTYITEQGGDYAAALTVAHQAVERLQHSSVASPMLAAGVFASTGFAEHLNGHNDVAQRLFERSVAQLTRAGREWGPEAIGIRSDWAIVSSDAGVPRRALEQYDGAIHMATLSDPASPPPPYLQANRAHALRSIGRFREAREFYQQCIAQTERSGPSMGLAACLLGFAGTSYEMGDFAAADQYVDRATKVVGASVPPNSPIGMSLLAARGTLAMAEGRHEQARAILDDVIANGHDEPIAIALNARAELNLRERRLVAAEGDARRLLSMSQAEQGGVPYSDRTGRAWLLLGRVLAQQGDATRARQAFEAAVTHLSRTVDDDHPLLLQARQLVRG